MQKFICTAARIRCCKSAYGFKELFVVQNSGFLTTRSLQTSASNKSRSPYVILGVNKEATLAEIKSAFYEKSKLVHPDVNPHAEAVAQFQEILRAYDILRVPKLRRLLDQGLLDPTGNEKPAQAQDSATEAEAEDLKRYREYTESAKRRGQKGRVETGKSQFYNYDEFYKMHYAEVLKQERADRAELRTRMRQTQEEETRVKRSHQAATFIMLTMGIVYVFYFFEVIVFKRNSGDETATETTSRQTH